MLEIKTLASGSSGNAYVISDGETTLLLEAGISVKQIAQQVSISSIDACLVSHEHGDHAKAAASIVEKYSIDLYASHGTLDFLNLSSDYRAHAIKSERQVNIGTFAVMPIEMKHDAAEPLGFIIGSSAGKLLFATDTYLIPYKIPRGTTALMLECNYSLEELNRSIALGVTEHRQRERLRMSHMSLEYLLRYLSENRDRLSAVSEIRLIHVSSRNGNKELFKNAVQAFTGLPVIV
jgi:phosphoribosyl 1,2-cyclic phosphodiesterase